MDSNYFTTIISEDRLIFDDRKSVSKTSFLIHLDEPLPCMYIANNDTSKMFVFWIHEGTMEINIDAKNVWQTKVTNSPLNTEFYESQRKSDSCTNLVYTPSIRAELLANPDIWRIKKDSLYALLEAHQNKVYEQWYKEAFKKTNSYFTLITISFFLEDYNRKREKALFDKQQLLVLFKKLPRNMKKYPTYTGCLKMFKQKLQPIPSINEPLYKKQ